MSGVRLTAQKEQLAVWGCRGWIGGYSSPGLSPGTELGLGSLPITSSGLFLKAHGFAPCLASPSIPWTLPEVCTLSFLSSVVQSSGKWHREHLKVERAGLAV